MVFGFPQLIQVTGAWISNVAYVTSVRALVCPAAVALVGVRRLHLRARSLSMMTHGEIPFTVGKALLPPVDNAFSAVYHR